MDTLTENLVAENLKRDGVARAAFESLDAFVRACGNIGEILAIDDVWHIGCSCQPKDGEESVPFHSDGPEADVVAWFCIRQDEDVGESLLADSIGILGALATEQRAHLCSINVPYFDHRRPEAPAGQCAVLRGNEAADWRINYVPWHMSEMNEEQRAAVSAFASELSKIRVTSIRLAPRDSLFVDNWRILHGRGPMRLDSIRHLKRIWLRTQRSSRLDRITPRWHQLTTPS